MFESSFIFLLMTGLSVSLESLLHLSQPLLIFFLGLFFLFRALDLSFIYDMGVIMSLIRVVRDHHCHHKVTV